jgi:hypothetical protein
MFLAHSVAGRSAVVRWLIGLVKGSSGFFASFFEIAIQFRAGLMGFFACFVECLPGILFDLLRCLAGLFPCAIGLGMSPGVIFARTSAQNQRQ